MRWFVMAAMGLALAACSDAVPTSDDPDGIPLGVETVEVRLPFSAFASGFQTFSGYGGPADLTARIVANDWNGVLDSSVLIRFADFPAAITIRPTGGGDPRPDSAYVPVGGRITLKFDTLVSLGDVRHELELGAIQTAWDVETATWEAAVDTLGGSVAWPEPGGGPARLIAAGVWDPAILADTIQIDTISFNLDSLTASEWGVGGPAKGLRIAGKTLGSRISLLSAELVVRARSSIRPDTLVQFPVSLTTSTFIYSPAGASGGELMLVGGAPASRATFRLELPESIDPPASACARVECPLPLRPEQIVFAGLSFRTRAASPGLQPLDTTFVELRQVLDPARLPRSPLGSPVHFFQPPLAPSYFTTATETRVEIGITAFVRSLLVPDSILVGERQPTLAVVASPEPAGFDIASFHAPGGELGPSLRLIVTLADDIPLP